ELAVTFEEKRGTISRVISTTDDVDAAVAAAAALAVNLARNQAAELLNGGAPPPAPGAAPPPPPPPPPPAPPPRPPQPAPAPASYPEALTLEHQPVTPRRAVFVMLGLLGGTGYGWASGHGDVNVDARFSGWSRAADGQVVAQAGLLLTGPQVLLSL